MPDTTAPHYRLVFLTVNSSYNTSQIIPADGNASFAGWSESPYPVNDPFFDTAKPFVQIETQRGCPMNCFYCTSGGYAPGTQSAATKINS